MQNSVDRQRLLRRYGQEPSNPITVLAKCAAGLLILLGILLIGLSAPNEDVGKQAATGATPPADVSTQNPPAAAGGDRN